MMDVDVPNGDCCCWLPHFVWRMCCRCCSSVVWMTLSMIVSLLMSVGNQDRRSVEFIASHTYLWSVAQFVYPDVFEYRRRLGEGQRAAEVPPLGVFSFPVLLDAYFFLVSDIFLFLTSGPNKFFVVFVSMPPRNGELLGQIAQLCRQVGHSCTIEHYSMNLYVGLHVRYYYPLRRGCSSLRLTPSL